MPSQQHCYLWSRALGSALPIAPCVFPSQRSLPTYGFVGCCFALSWSESFRDAIVHASDVTCVRYSQNVATELLPILLGTFPCCLLELLRAALNVLRVFSLGERLYSVLLLWRGSSLRTLLRTSQSSGRSSFRIWLMLMYEWIYIGGSRCLMLYFGDFLCRWLLWRSLQISLSLLLVASWWCWCEASLEAWRGEVSLVSGGSCSIQESDLCYSLRCDRCGWEARAWGLCAWRWSCQAGASVTSVDDASTPGVVALSGKRCWSHTSRGKSKTLVDAFGGSISVSGILVYRSRCSCFSRAPSWFTQMISAIFETS